MEQYIYVRNCAFLSHFSQHIARMVLVFSEQVAMRKVQEGTGRSCGKGELGGKRNDRQLIRKVAVNYGVIREEVVVVRWRYIFKNQEKIQITDRL